MRKIRVPNLHKSAWMHSVVAILCAGILQVTLYAQSSTTATCTKWAIPEKYQSSIGNEHDPRIGALPSVFGPKINVPSMTVKLEDGATAMPLDVQSIRVNYGWQWLEYPYPEHAWGAWLDASDQVACALDPRGAFQTPPHIVTTRGWYQGKHLRKPRFTDVEIVAVTTGGFARTHIKPVDFPRFANSTLRIQVFDGWRTVTTWIPDH